MRFMCRWFGHWWKRGKVIQVPGNDHVANYRLCHFCGEYHEDILPNWELKN